jgi:dGTPase
MKSHGGFDHNIQGLRVVDLLEERYPGFPGLNLTWEVRESINKHRTPYDPSTRPPEAGSLRVVPSEHRESRDDQPRTEGMRGQPDLQVALDPKLAPLLESQIADIADEIAYDNHDLDDGLTSGILKEEDLGRIELWQQARDSVESQRPQANHEIRKYQIIRTLINQQVTDLVQATVQHLTHSRIGSVEDVRACRERLVTLSDEMQRLRAPLKQLLWNQLYHHYRVVRMADKAKRFIAELFHLYLKKPEQLPNTTRSRIERGEDPSRVVCDYLAGMTDRYCLEEYKKLFDPFERV